MGNLIEIGEKKIGAPFLKLSNGATSVLLTLLGLSGSRLARENCEKKLLVWLLERDQSYCGIGTVGFSLYHMPWEEKEFEKQKAFMMGVVDAAIAGMGWNTLNYKPNKELILPVLSKLKQMFSLLESDDINYENVSR